MPDTTTDAPKSQAKRILAVSTPLGDDRLLIQGLHGGEALGRLFQFEIDLLAMDDPVKPGDILGKNVTVRVQKIDGSVRYFNGYVSRFSFVSFQVSKKKERMYTYRATLVPWTWFLTRTADCRIFQAMTVKDIVEKIFRDRGFTDFRANLYGSYRTWDYCVQYRETDFNFISRLLENEGIYYYFEHENGKHTLVLCDSPNAHAAADGYDDLHADTPDLATGHDAYIWDLTHGQEITPTQYALTDYDPLQPRSLLAKAVTVTHDHDPDTFEVFDYPGGYVTPDEGRSYATVRMEEVEAQYAAIHATSSARGIYAGCTFRLIEHPVFDVEEYLITAVSYQARNDDMGTGAGGEGGDFASQVTCMLKTYEFRPARTTPKPVVQGPQTAVVVGPAGQEIYTDKYGRVKIKFHWDRSDVMDETASCWVRVSQPLAGKKWGAVSIPRIGQEVIVDFLEGDPDRPIITGRVYNGDNLPPHDLPGHATMFALRTNTSPDGGGASEFRIEDKKDEEQIFLFSQKNLDVRAKNDRFETIEHDRHLVVDNHKFEHVKQKRHELVDVDHQEEIKNDRHLKVGGKEAKEVVGSKSLKVTGEVIEEFEDNHSEVVTKDYYLKADNIVIEGMTSVTIKVGQNSIAIDKSGISVACQETMAAMEITATGDATVEAQMNAGMKAGVNLDLEGTAAATLKGTGQLTLKTDGMGELNATGMLSVQSSAILTVKGSLVNIN
jgi:type VI secretion system secreted protein VgrG